MMIIITNSFFLSWPKITRKREDLWTGFTFTIAGGHYDLTICPLFLYLPVLYPMIHCSATPMKEAGSDDLVDPLLSKSSISNDSENLEMYQGEPLPSSLKNLDGFSPLCNIYLIVSGVYRELKRVIPPDAWIHSHEPSSPPAKTWLFIGYKSLEKTLDPTLLTTWKEWTGARHIYLNLRHDFDIQRISFYSRVSPLDNIDLFMYLVIMEIGNVNERNVMWLLDFIQRIRVQRISGFLTLYSQVEPQSQYSAKPNGSTSFLEKFFKSGDTKGEGEGSATSRKHFIEKLLQEINDTPILDLC